MHIGTSITAFIVEKEILIIAIKRDVGGAEHHGRMEFVFRKLSNKLRL